MTKLSTLLAGGEFVQLAAGTAACVLATADWHAKTAKLAPAQDVARANQKAMLLGNTPFGVAVQTSWCSRLQGHPDLFEIRINGIRYYGGNLGAADATAPAVIVLVFAGAEQKGGRRHADDAQIAAAQLAVAVARDKFAATNVVQFRVQKRK